MELSIAPRYHTKYNRLYPIATVQKQGQPAKRILSTRRWREINGKSFLATHRQGDEPGGTPVSPLGRSRSQHFLHDYNLNFLSNPHCISMQHARIYQRRNARVSKKPSSVRDFSQHYSLRALDLFFFFFHAESVIRHISQVHTDKAHRKMHDREEKSLCFAGENISSLSF